MSLAIFDFINYIFLPEYCITCGNPDNYICASCLKFKFKINFQNTCHVCGYTSFTNRLHKECEDSTNLDNLLFFCEYNFAAKKLIQSIKYNGNYSILNRVSEHMVRYLNFNTKYSGLDKILITSVPSHRKKKNIRGFNQSELLAKKIAAASGIEYKNILKKVQNTKMQAGTSKNSRNTNLRNTIEPLAENVSGTVMIVDDVHTTGATLNECAGVLKKMGASRVVGYTFAKSMKYSTIESLDGNL